jgi:hypothetical protein
MFDERLLLISELISHISRMGHKIVGCVPYQNKEVLQSEHPGIVFDSHPMMENQKLNELLTGFWRSVQNPALSPSWYRDLQNGNRFSGLLHLINKKTKFHKQFRYLIKAIDENLVNRNNLYTNILKKHKPDLVITTTDFTFQDRMITRLARKMNIKTVRVIRSWDNITTRGHLYERPDFFIVWNERNKKELIELHGVNPAEIFICGAPHFDVYHQYQFMNKPKLWSEYCFRKGFDKEKRLIYILGSVERSGWMLKDIVEILIESIDGGKIVFPCQVLIRPHPNVIHRKNGPGNDKELMSWQGLSKDIHIERPKMKSRAGASRIKKEDSLVRSENIFFSDVVIHFYSTIAIEAAAVDKPNITIGFDGKNDSNLVRRFEKYMHIRALLDTGGVRIATSRDDLINAINEFFSQPTKNAKERRHIVERFFYRNDGKAVERVAQVITTLL